MKPFHSLTVHRGSSLLIIVDMQNEFCKLGGKSYSPENEPVISRTMGNIRDLSERVRAAGIPVLYIQSVRTLKEPQFTVFHRPPHLVVNTWASQIVDELTPRQGENVVQKFSHDPFFGTRLDQVLSSLVPDPTKFCALITGGSINVCCYHTTLGFHLRNYWTVLVEDAVYSLVPGARELALGMLSIGYPNVYFSRTSLITASREFDPGPPSLPLVS